MYPQPGQADTILGKIQQIGLRSLSVSELLAALVAEDLQDADAALPNVIELMKRRTLTDLAELGMIDFAELGNFEEKPLQRIRIAIELGRRIGNANRQVVKTIERAKDIAAYFGYLADENREHFCVLMLNSRNGILGSRTIHIGTVNSTLVGAREVFREAIREGAATIAVVHNHPSGDPEPSVEDIDVTEVLVRAGKMLDIPVIDHVIVGHQRYVSLKDLGYL